jgi:hypothetical protein
MEVFMDFISIRAASIVALAILMLRVALKKATANG